MSDKLHLSRGYLHLINPEGGRGLYFGATLWAYLWTRSDYEAVSRPSFPSFIPDVSHFYRCQGVSIMPAINERVERTPFGPLAPLGVVKRSPPLRVFHAPFPFSFPLDPFRLLFFVFSPLLSLHCYSHFAAARSRRTVHGAISKKGEQGEEKARIV